MAATSADAQAVGTGTGFVINEDGLAVTNAHVVELKRGGQLCRALSARRGLDRFKVQYLAHDTKTDLALVRVLGIGAPKGYRPTAQPAQKPQPAAKSASSGGSWSLTGDDGGDGSSGLGGASTTTQPAPAASASWVAPIRGAANAVRQGEQIFAVGYPYGSQLSDQHKIVQGIVSSTSGLRGDITRFQMSAEINPGNSGGPVIDAGGNVVGVSVAGHVSIVKAATQDKQGNVSQGIAQQHTAGIKFAVQLSALHTFLAAHGATFTTANAPANRATVDLAREAGSYTIQLTCYK